MHHTKLFIIHSVPLAFGILLNYLFWRDNQLLFVLYILVIFGVIGSGKDRRAEIKLFVFGIISGFVIETVGARVAGYQSWAMPQAPGFPWWLLLAWGYMPILLKRLALIITIGSPWTPKEK